MFHLLTQTLFKKEIAYIIFVHGTFRVRSLYKELRFLGLHISQIELAQNS
jgi:hypothetical protein